MRKVTSAQGYIAGVVRMYAVVKRAMPEFRTCRALYARIQRPVCPRDTRFDDDEMRSHRYPPRNGPAESEDLHVAKLKLLDLREEEAQARAEYLAILQRLAPSTVNG